MPRVLDLSDNALSGPFPTFLITQPVQVQAACQGKCDMAVFLNGTNMALQCPGHMQITEQEWQYLRDAEYECLDNGKKVRDCVCTRCTARTNGICGLTGCLV